MKCKVISTRIVTLALIVLSTFSGYCQTISGKVAGTDMSPITGATVHLSPQNLVTTTDINGVFTFFIAPKDSIILRVSLVGYIPKETRLKYKEGIIITLEESFNQLNETVVYGKTETAAAKEMSIKAEVLDMKQVHSLPMNISELMNRSSGIRIRQTGGLGSATDVNLNGFQGKSIRYFRDGIPMDYLGEGFSLSALPVNMLERIEIFKGVLPVNLGSDALGGGVNLVARKFNKNYAEVSYEIGSFNTHRANFNAYFLKNNFFYGVDAFLNHSDNNYKVNVKVTDPETRNLIDAKVNLFHNAYTGYFSQLFAGLKNLSWADEIRIDIAGFKFNREQQHPALMTEPYGGIVAKQNSVIPSLRYQKSFSKLNVDQFLAYNNLIINRIDTTKGTYDWYGNFTSNTLRNGESSRPSNAAINNRYFTSRTNLKYSINHFNALEFNQTFIIADRKGKDPLGAKFSDTNIDVLTLPSKYTKAVTTLGLSSDFYNRKINNQFILKYFSYDASGVETFQAIGINSTDAQSISGDTWGIAEAIKFEVLKNHFIRVSAEYSNRLPDHAELFGDAVWIVQNFSIKPERSLNASIGWRSNVNRKFTFELNTFYRRTKDLILLVPIQAPYARYENQQNVKGLGVETDFSLNINSQFSLTANGTYQNMRLFGITNSQDIWKNDARLRNTPFLFGNAGINYLTKPIFNKKATLKTFVYYSYLHEYYLETIPKRLEGNGIFSKANVNTLLVILNQHLLNAGVLLNLPSNRISVGIDVKNILNHDIFDNYRVQRAGRSFHLKINYSII